MKTIFALVAALALALPAHAAKPAPVDPERDTALQEIRDTFGVTPGFFNEIAPEVLAGFWAEMKDFQLGSGTALSNKDKALIGVAVSSQIPCPRCTYFHSQLARLYGASDAELRLAVAEAGLTRSWSTWFNGVRVDDDEFRADVVRRMEHLRTAGPRQTPLATITDAASARADIEYHLGAVPRYLATFPPTALPGAWMAWRRVELEPAALSPKQLHLISLGVSAQIACKYCILAHTEEAKFDGAKEPELAEAVAVAGFTRELSALLNGMSYDEARFRRDVAVMVGALRRHAASTKTAQR